MIFEIDPTPVNRYAGITGMLLFQNSQKHGVKE
jgi:hypothetical protein